MKKKINLIFAFVCVTIGLIACNGTSKSKEDTTITSNRDAGEIYTAYCVQCHGTDGKKGTLGAKDLTITALSFQEKVDIISNGRRSMPGYKSSMSTKEIENVARYIENLK